MEMWDSLSPLRWGVCLVKLGGPPASQMPPCHRWANPAVLLTSATVPSHISETRGAAEGSLRKAARACVESWVTLGSMWSLLRPCLRTEGPMRSALRDIWCLGSAPPGTQAAPPACRNWPLRRGVLEVMQEVCALGLTQEQAEWAAPVLLAPFISSQEVLHQRACIWLSEDSTPTPGTAVTLPLLSLTPRLLRGGPSGPRAFMGARGSWGGWDSSERNPPNVLSLRAELHRC